MKLSLQIPDEINDIITALTESFSITSIAESSGVSTITTETLTIFDNLSETMILKSGMVVTIGDVNYQVSNIVNSLVKTFDVTATNLTDTEWNVAASFKFGSRNEINQALNQENNNDSKLKRFPLIWLFTPIERDFNNQVIDFESDLVFSFAFQSNKTDRFQKRLDGNIKTILEPLLKLFLLHVQSSYFNYMFEFEGYQKALDIQTNNFYFYGTSDQSKSVLNTTTDAIEVQTSLKFKKQFEYTLGVIPPTPDINVPIILILGQSNAQGSRTNKPIFDYLREPITNSEIYFEDSWQTLDYPINNYALDNIDHGSELSIGYYAKEKVYICKTVLGGSSIVEGVTVPSWDENETGGLFDDAVSNLLSSVSALESQGFTPYIAGIFWSQWETDNNNTDYDNLLISFINAFRNAIGSVNDADIAPFIISRASINATLFPGRVQMQGLQDSVAATQDNVSIIDTDDLTKYPIYSDNSHYKSIAQINLGNEFLKAINFDTQSIVDNEFAFTIVGDSFTLPARVGFPFNAVIKWGDGESNTITAYDDIGISHTYASSGTYQIRITGKFGGWSFNNVGDKLKIISVDNWGDVGFEYLQAAFFGCTNLITIDAGYLDLSLVDSLFRFVVNCPNLTKIYASNWNLSTINSLSGFAQSCTNLAEIDVSKWNVSNVSIMTNMMYACSSLIEFDTSDWDTDSITDCSYMVFNCTSLVTAFSDVLWWNRAVPIASFSKCFNGSINISNYASIPAIWK